jgi:hypothetical protein
MSRIISKVSDIPEDDDIPELISLVDELNRSEDLTVKFKTNRNIIKYLDETQKDHGEENKKREKTNYRDEVNKAVHEFG